MDKGDDEGDENLTEAGVEGSRGRRFMRKHWRAVAAFAVAVVLAAAGAVYVFLWFVENAQTTGLVPRTLGLWTMANLVTFILYAVFWELLLIAVPVAIGAVVAWQWWKRLPAEERTGYRLSAK